MPITLAAKSPRQCARDGREVDCHAARRLMQYHTPRCKIRVFRIHVVQKVENAEEAASLIHMPMSFRWHFRAITIFIVLIFDADITAAQ